MKVGLCSRRGLVLVGLLFSLFVLSVSVTLAETEGDFVHNGGIITDYTGAGGDIVIPATLGGYPVIAIGWEAFQNKGLTSITIPDGLISIGPYAFKDNQLVSLLIPDSVTSIGNSAFENNRLTSLTLGNGITRLERNTFTRNNLTTVDIPDSVEQIEHHAFAQNKLTAVSTGKNLLRIGVGAFQVNEITSLTFGNYITEIDSLAFSGNKLSSITIPSSVSIIGEAAFSFNELISVFIPNCATLIDRHAFSYNQATSVDLTIHALAGSFAEAYAIAYNHTFVAMEGDCGDGGDNGTAGRTLGDFVWNDLNRDGIQDAGEPGMAGVMVNLWSTNTACEPVEVIASTVTDSNGIYSFTGLLMGNYRVQFVSPAGHVFTLQHVGLDQGLDSNPDPATGITGCITLESENNMTVDAGIYYQGDPVDGDDDTNGELPQTGGYPYYALGLLGLVGGALTFRRKQK